MLPPKERSVCLAAGVSAVCSTAVTSSREEVSAACTLVSESETIAMMSDMKKVGIIVSCKYMDYGWMWVQADLLLRKIK